MSKKKYAAIDLFAGAGGFGLGFSMSDFEILCSLEIDKWAGETLRNNFDHKIINDSILNYVNKSKIFPVIQDKPDVIIGGPPCQGFSHAGKRESLDPRNKMYLQFYNWVNLLRPKIFVIENVRGILSFTNCDGTKVIEEIKSKFSSIGYGVNVWQLNSQNYGVPQSRERVFIVGHANNEILPPPPISHSNTIDELQPILTVNDAICDLPIIHAKEGAEILPYDHEPKNQYQIKSREDSFFVYNHEAMKHTDRMVKRYQHIISGNSMDNISEELGVRKRNGNGELSNIKFSLNYRHLHPDFPSFTIPAHFYSSFIHPTIPRNITTREAARIQSFPDRYRFYGKRTMISSKLLMKLGREDELNHLSQYNQVGNAVPPLLAFKVAEHIKQYL